MPNFHPILVHFTIALFVTSVLFDLIGYFTHRESFKVVGRWNLILAGLFAIPTVVTGLIAESTLPHTDKAHQLMEIHKTLGLVLLGILIILGIWRAKKKIPFGKMAGLYLLIGLGGIGVMTAGAYYGGEMVYTHGMGVAPMMAQMEVGHDHAGHVHGDHEAAGIVGHHEVMKSEVSYSCPMHPEVISDEPGNCPKCGMILQKVPPSSEQHEAATKEKQEVHGTEEHSHNHDDDHDHGEHGH